MVASAYHRDQINHVFCGGRIRRHCPERNKIGARQCVQSTSRSRLKSLTASGVFDVNSELNFYVGGNAAVPAAAKRGGRVVGKCSVGLNDSLTGRTALLTIQFCRADPCQENNRDRPIKLIGIGISLLRWALSLSDEGYLTLLVICF